MTTIDDARVARILAEAKLRKGSGSGINGQIDACIMQCVDYITGAAYAADAAADAAGRAASEAHAAADAADAAGRKIWVLATGILDEALRIGKQAEPLDTAQVVERMAAIRQFTHA